MSISTQKFGSKIRNRKVLVFMGSVAMSSGGWGGGSGRVPWARAPSGRVDTEMDIWNKHDMVNRGEILLIARKRNN